MISFLPLAHFICLDMVTLDLSLFHKGMIEPVDTASCSFLANPLLYVHPNHRPERSLVSDIHYDNKVTPLYRFPHLSAILPSSCLCVPKVSCIVQQRISVGGETSEYEFALSDFASCATRLIGAKIVRRVIGSVYCFFHKHIMPKTVLFFKPLPQFHWLVWLLPPFSHAPVSPFFILDRTTGCHLSNRVVWISWGHFNPRLENTKIRLAAREHAVLVQFAGQALRQHLYGLSKTLIPISASPFPGSFRLRFTSIEPKMLSPKR